MGIKQAAQDLISRLRIQLKRGPIEKAVPEHIIRIPSNMPGFERPTNKMTEIYRRFQIEHGRLQNYRDYWIGIRENPLFEAGILKLVLAAAGEPFHIKCDYRRAKDEADELFHRIGYWGQKRIEILCRLLGLGDYFGLVDRDYAPSRKRNIAEITSLRTAREYTMFRMSDGRGAFPNWEKAFVQYPDLEILVEAPGGIVVWEGVQYYLAGTTYGGILGAVAGNSARLTTDRRIELSVEDVIHARRLPSWQSAPDGYGVGLFRSARIETNAEQMNSQDLAIARKLKAYQNLHFNLEKDASDDSYNELKEKMEREPEVNEIFVTRGANAQVLAGAGPALTKIDDIWFHVGGMDLCSGASLLLSGFGAERFSGEILNIIKETQRQAIAFVNQMEEFEIIRPLLSRQYWYSGLSDVKYEIEYPEVSLEDLNKKTKRIHSAVGIGLMSRETAARQLYRMTPEEWRLEEDRIVRETEKLGPPGKYIPPPENLNKGKKGVSREPSETQDIGDVEDYSDE